MNNVEVTVFLVSLKAGGVALNLTEASRVYLMDSWYVLSGGSYATSRTDQLMRMHRRWNPAVEFREFARLVSRKHRMSHSLHRGNGSYPSSWSASPCACYKACG